MPDSSAADVTTPSAFWSRATTQPDQLAVVAVDGTRVSYGQLLEGQNRTANALLAHGLVPGDTVAVLLWNQPEFLELALACSQVGMYFLPINTHLSAPEIAYVLRDSQASLFVAAERVCEAGAQAAAEAGLSLDNCFEVGARGTFRSFDEFKAAQPGTTPTRRMAGATMVYTSGTTGRPKGVRRPLSGDLPEVSAAFAAGFVTFFCGAGAGDGSVQLVTGPLYHATPGGLALAALHLGHVVVLMDKWSPARTLELVEQQRVTYMHVVPTMFHRLLSLPEAERAQYDTSSLRCVLHGAAPCSIPVKHQMIEWLGPIVTEYYGSSEGGGALVRSAEWLQRPGTVGQPWPGSTLLVTDATGAECPPGVTGDVWIKMAGYDFEYHNDPEKTRASTRDGFFTVGDRGYLDESGYLFLSGRTAELIISGGTNIYPAEIEHCLLSHDAVRDAAVIGVPNAEWGEEVKAVVELHDGNVPGEDLAGELLAHCRRQLASFKVPRSVDFRPALPRTETGKLMKRLLIDDARRSSAGPTP